MSTIIRIGHNVYEWSNMLKRYVLINERGVKQEVEDAKKSKKHT